jgi:hypothetical protein
VIRSGGLVTAARIAERARRAPQRYACGLGKIILLWTTSHRVALGSLLDLDNR